MLLLIADAHYGWWKSKAPPLAELIDKVKENHTITKTILLGDIIDLWRRKISDVIIEQQQNIERIYEKDIIYIKGNHDFIIDEILPGLKIKERIKLKNTWLMHGYQFDILASGIPKEEYTKTAKILCYTNNTMGKILSLLWKGCHILHSGHKRTHNSFNNIMYFANAIFKSSNSHCIFGHFHRYKKLSNATSLNALCNGYYYIYDKKTHAIKELFF